MQKIVIKRTLGHFLFYLFFITSIIGVGVLLYFFGPTESIYSDTDWDTVDRLVPPGYNETKYNILLDQHSHSIYSADARLTIRQDIKWLYSMGYNACVVTDHNTLANKAEIDALKIEFSGQFIIIQGMEWTTNRFHMNFIGIDHWSLQIPLFPTDQQIQEAIDEAHSQGAIVVCNHYPFNTDELNPDPAKHPTRMQLLSWGIDYFEITNDDSHPTVAYNTETVAFCEANGVGQITGTDMHRPDKLGSGGVHGWTQINVTEFSESAIMTELEYNRTKILYFSSGLKDPGIHEVNPWYQWVRPLVEIGTSFVNLGRGIDELDFPGIISYTVYIFLLFAAIELTNLGKARFWQRHEQREIETGKGKKEE
jgi:predicted metal-dependent phosphoesterase TrpH